MSDNTSAPSRPTPSPADVAKAHGGHFWGAMITFTALGALAMFVLIERKHYAALLQLDLMDVGLADRALLTWMTASKTCVYLLPGALAAGLVHAWGWRRRGTFLFLAVSFAVLSLQVLDLWVYRSFGRHLLDLWQFADQPAGYDMAGRWGPWVWMIAQAVGMVTLCGLVIWLLATRLSRTMIDGRSWTGRPTIRTPLLIVLALVILAPLGLRDALTQPILHMRLYSAIPVDLRFTDKSFFREGHKDPVLNELYRRLSPIYRSFQPIIYTPKPLDREATVEAPDRPNVVVIMIESWRADVFEKGLMPRLAEWSRRGWRLNRHYAGSYRSESGMFSLLYGRSPMVYRSTLDAGIPPQLNETLRRSGYVTAYYSGHPKKWWWREKFVNPETFDRFVHNDVGSWPQWDRKALKQMARDVNQSDKPTFSLCFLMSSHFEYQYPPEYELHTPVERSIRWTPTNIPAVGPEHRELLYNRYRNTMAFLDEEIHRTITALDPSRTIIVITGDHGEAIGENDQFGHYHMYGDVSSRTPAVIVGPGFPPRQVNDLTVHQDLLPTLIHAMNGRPTPLKHVQGRDLFRENDPRQSLLLVNYDRKWVIKVRLLHEDLRLFLQLFDDESAMEIVGLEDAQGRSVINHGIQMEDIDRWAEAFETEMQPFLN